MTAIVDAARVFHVGLRVAELGAAMGELGDELGLTWSTVIERDQAVWTPERGAATVALRFTYSREGPQRIELLEGEPGSVWDARNQAGLHHVGVWADDVAASTEELVAAGWILEAAQRPPADGYGSFTYVRSPGATLRVEPVSTAMRPAFERWWAGGPLGGADG